MLNIKIGCLYKPRKFSIYYSYEFKRNSLSVNIYS